VTEHGLADLRARLVGELRARGDVRTPRVATAFGRVPRHVFVPGVAPDDVYADRSIAIKLDDGVPISSSSQPAIMAQMLEMLALRGGERVLEVGTGSGYNAALLAELVGPHGAVTTVDIDPELVAAARRQLDEAGYAQVRTIAADGAAGDSAGAPFDAIIATVGVECIPAAWIAQLRAGGRLVAPLTIRSMQKVVAFERTADGLESDTILDAGFIMLRGPSATQHSRTIALGDPATTLNVLAPNAVAIDAAAMVRALRARAHDTHPVRHLDVRDAWEGFTFWLALHDDAFCRVTAQGASASDGHVPNLVPGGATSYGVASTFGLGSGGDLVLLAARGPGDLMLRRFGAGTGLIERLQSAIAGWDDAGRPGNAAVRVAVDADGASRVTVRPQSAYQ
jgi:protein-L-isoaspartate(D-aspartate) O-methyltransferase